VLSCNPLLHPSCIGTKFIPPLTGSLTGGLFSGIEAAINEGIRWIVVNTTTWWIQIPSPHLSSEPAVTRLQAWLLPVTVAVAVGGVIGGGLRMAISRRANPMLDVAGGIVTLATAVTLGVILPALLLKAGDEWSSWVLQASTGGHFTQRLQALLNFGGKAATAVAVVLSLAAIIMALIQAILMLFRQVALLILVGVLPLAAAGAAAPLTKPWIRKISSWMLALICYKPAAAAVYATAFTLIGTGGSLTTVLLGFVTLLLSVIMLPALMKFFSWTTGSIAESGGGGGQFLGAAAVGAVAVGALRSGTSGAGSAAQDQAAYLDSRLGPPGSSQPGPPPGPGSGPSSPNGSPPPASSATPAPASPSPAASAPAGATGSSYATPAPATASAAPTAGSTGTAAAASGAAEASAGSAAATGAAATAATGAAAAAGPVGLAVAGAIQAGEAAAKTTSRLAQGAMEPEEGK
jgi:hypothetical protein